MSHKELELIQLHIDSCEGKYQALNSRLEQVSDALDLIQNQIQQLKKEFTALLIITSIILIVSIIITTTVAVNDIKRF